MLQDFDASDGIPWFHWQLRIRVALPSAPTLLVQRGKDIDLDLGKWSNGYAPLRERLNVDRDALHVRDPSSYSAVVDGARYTLPMLEQILNDTMTQAASWLTSVGAWPPPLPGGV